MVICLFRVIQIFFNQWMMLHLFQNSLQTGIGKKVLQMLIVGVFSSSVILCSAAFFFFYGSAYQTWKPEGFLTGLEHLTNHYFALFSPLFQLYLQMKKIGLSVEPLGNEKEAIQCFPWKLLLQRSKVWKAVMYYSYQQDHM